MYLTLPIFIITLSDKWCFAPCQRWELWSRVIRGTLLRLQLSGNQDLDKRSDSMPTIRINCAVFAQWNTTQWWKTTALTTRMYRTRLKQDRAPALNWVPRLWFCLCEGQKRAQQTDGDGGHSNSCLAGKGNYWLGSSMRDPWGQKWAEYTYGKLRCVSCGLQICVIYMCHTSTKKLRKVGWKVTSLAFKSILRTNWISKGGTTGLRIKTNANSENGYLADLKNCGEKFSVPLVTLF